MHNPAAYGTNISTPITVTRASDRGERVNVGLVDRYGGSGGRLVKGYDVVGKLIGFGLETENEQP